MKFEKAESILTRGIKLGPQVAYNYGLRAYVRIRLEDFDGAIADCSSKLELKPKDASIYALRGWALYCQEDYTNAISDINKALELDPKRAKDYQDSLRLVDCYQREGRDDDAVDFCTRLLKLKIEPFYQLELFGRRAISLYRRKRFDECLSDLDKAINFAGLSDKAELHKMKADVLNELADVEKANIQLDIYQGLKQFEAQITEWVPASIFKRVLAQLVDATASGIVIVLLFSLGVVISGLLKIVSIETIESVVLLLIPCGSVLFLLAFLDSIFVCVVPVLLLLCIMELVAAHGRPVEAVALSPAQETFILLLILIGLLNLIYNLWFPLSRYQATPGKLLLKVKLTSLDGGRMGVWQLTGRHMIRAIESLLFLSIFFFCSVLLVVANPFPLKLLVAFLFVPILSVISLFCLKPGLHNSFTSGFVSDVSMFFDKQIKEFREN